MGFENVTNLELGPNDLECPVCSGDGKLIEGAFDVGSTDEDVVVRDAPDWTIDVLRAMQVRFVRLLKEQPDDVASEVEKSLPDEDTRALWRRAVKRLDESQTLSLLVKLSTITSGVAAAPEAAAVARAMFVEMLHFVERHGRLPW